MPRDDDDKEDEREEEFSAEEAEARERFVAPADWDGPVESRRCTDLFCFFLLVASWIAMTYIGAYAISNGDYRLVINPLDYDGNVCGTDFGSVDMSDFPNLLYVNQYAGVCVSKCPSIDTLTEDNATDVRTLITYSGIWQTEDGLAQLDATNLPFEVADYSQSQDALACSTDTCFPNNDPEQSWTSTGINRGFGFAYYVGDTYEFFHRCYLTQDAETSIRQQVGSVDRAIPDDPVEVANNDFFVNLYADLWVAKYYILGCGFGIALFISIIYMYLLRIPGLLTTVVWVSIFSTIAMVIGAGYYAYSNADKWSNTDPQPFTDKAIAYTRYFAYAMWVIGAFLLLIACCLRKQIQLAISCVKEAGRAINRMLLIFVVPFIQVFAFLIFWVVWTVYAVYLASLGDITTPDLDLVGPDVAVRVYEFDDFVYQSGWYLLFCMFWTAGFIVAFGDMVVAMAVSKWYFTVDKSSVSSLTVLRSLTLTLLFHLGTCAYGSLIIAIIKMIRAVLAKIQKEVAKADNSCANCILCCCQCCFMCVEKCLKFINKNAYIQTAIFGTPFCESARKAFFLILRNAARIGAVSYVSAAVLVVGKLFISAMTTGLSYFILVETVEVDLHSYAGPLALIFFISYMIADMCMDIFEIAILAMLHCFVADEEMFDGRARYAEGALTEWVDKNGAEED
eukprot:CAMPEP_0119551812 /NCGR_PEP_ID=MMETSP1352-20130426/4955_1 /TAXON_ID=265584 /ORGANISM="Stauroneis constricta, Strain CCMP1120" /LENGTH=677 /DNA_ID=CAMNT_0007597927 /DNA_START=70 /DNA_END=2103 /DNA_ORIENTATION=-